MDYIIIGGGVYGCGVAWELARRGGDVMLLEAGAVAGGASGGLGKRGVRANGRDLRELPLMQLAYERWPDLHQELGCETSGATGYERLGHLQLIERETDLASAPATAWMQEQQGIPTHQLDAAAVREMEPFVGEQIVSALYCPKDGVADHTTTTRSFAQAAQRAGAQIREQTKVASVEASTGRVNAVITEQGERIPVGKALILLSNSHVPTLLQETFNLTLPVWSMLPQVMLTGVVDPMPLNHLIGHAHRVLAMKPEKAHGDTGSSGQVMISGGWRGRWNKVAQRGETQSDQVAGNLAEAVAVYPSLKGIEVAEADAGRLEMINIDGVPIIDNVSGAENLYYATGWSGHGWAIAPTVTRLMADWVWSGDRSNLLQPFAYRRFEQ